MTVASDQLVGEARADAKDRRSQQRRKRAPRKSGSAQCVGERTRSTVRGAIGVDPVRSSLHLRFCETEASEVVDLLEGNQTCARGKPLAKPLGPFPAEPALTVEDEEWRLRLHGFTGISHSFTHADRLPGMTHLRGELFG